MVAFDAGDRVISIAEVTTLTGLSKTTIWRLYCREEFPRPFRLSPGRVGWSERSVIDWISRAASSAGARR